MNKLVNGFNIVKAHIPSMDCGDYVKNVYAFVQKIYLSGMLCRKRRLFLFPVGNLNENGVCSLTAV